MTLLSSCTRILFVLCGIVVITSRANAEGPEDLCALAPAALAQASAIRGLTVSAPVPCLVQDKEAVKGFLDETIARDLPPQKLDMEQIAYRAIGMIPDDFDYGAKLVQFLVSQLGGYYDPKKKRFVMAAWLPAMVQETVAVHELTHALQDQHYDLGKLLDPSSENSDRSVALSALIEGDASAVMIDNERRSRGLSSISNDVSIDGLILQQVLGAGFSSSNEGVPESLKAILIFPYTSGLRFAHALMRKGGYPAVGRAYGRLPQSTREILHPAEYIAGSFTPRIPESRELEGAENGAPPLYTDVIGEFGISSLFANGATTRQRAAHAAVGWIGDRLAIFSRPQDKRLVSWKTRWESEQDAREFYDLYRDFIREKYGVTLLEPVTSLTSRKSVRLVRHGSEVSLSVTLSE